MTRSILVLISMCSTLLLAPGARADVLELKSGTILDGKYVGGTATTVRFEVAGKVQVVATSDLVALTFTGAAAAGEPEKPAVAQPPQSAPAPPAASPAPAQPVTLPAGTSLIVRLKDGISSRNRAGTPFTAKLEYDLYLGGTRALPAGTLLYGVVKSSTEARRLRGQSTLDLRLNKVAVGGAAVALESSGYTVAGDKAIKDAARGAAAGAAIGAIVDGGNGAGKGAAIGATVGALKRGETITIPPGALLEFQLARPLTIQPGK